VTVKVNVPLASVVAVPVPTLHLPVTVAPEMAKPVAVVPVTVRLFDMGASGAAASPPPPPHAISVSEVRIVARSLIFAPEY